jgi:AmmeMemoRadiSam system protein B
VDKVAQKSAHVREARFADGMWYQSDSAKLDAAVQSYLSQEITVSPARLMGLVAPHAGHRFSGHVAGAAFGGLQPGSFDVVILLGPDHHGAALGRTSTPNVQFWRTPLGDIPVAWEILDLIKDKIHLALLPDDDEHALEIELPFLQKTLGQFRLAPLLLGDQSHQTCQQLCSVLVEAVQQTGQRALFVASSDLSHFFDDDTARRLDHETIRFVLNLDARGLLDHVAIGRIHGHPLACGAGAIATVIMAARSQHADNAHLLKYATSADVSHDHGRVVGYTAIAFTRK